MRVYFCCRELPEKQSQHALAYSILERAAADNYPVCAQTLPVYEKDAHGKPYRRDCPWLQFNISHCRKGVAAALGRWPVGIDIEQRFAWKESLARRICQRQELEWLLSLPEDGQRAAWLNRIWSRKEGYLKCTGSGFYRDPREFSVLCAKEKSMTMEKTVPMIRENDPEDVLHINLQIDGNGVHFWELQRPEFTLTACSGDAELECFEQVV